MLADESLTYLSSALRRDQLADLVVVTAGLGEEIRRDVARALRIGAAKSLAPGVVSIFAPEIAGLMSLGFQMAEATPPAPTWEMAGAISERFGHRLCLPMEAARWILGLEDRPLAPRRYFWTGESRAFPRAGIAFEKVDARVAELSPFGQAIVLALPLDSSESGLLALGDRLASGLMSSDYAKEWLRRDLELDGAMDERHRFLAEAILASRPRANGQLPSRAPLDFVPPEEACRLDGWRLIQPWNDDAYALTADVVHGHPYVPDGGRFPRSSEVLWIDETLRYAGTTSRIYKLGLRRGR